VDKFLGMGLKKSLAFLFFIIIGIVMMKVIFTKYEVPGVSQLVQMV